MKRNDSHPRRKTMLYKKNQHVILITTPFYPRKIEWKLPFLYRYFFNSIPICGYITFCSIPVLSMEPAVLPRLVAPLNFNEFGLTRSSHPVHNLPAAEVLTWKAWSTCRSGSSWRPSVCALCVSGCPWRCSRRNHTPRTCSPSDRCAWGKEDKGLCQKKDIMTNS